MSSIGIPRCIGKGCPPLSLVAAISWPMVDYMNCCIAPLCNILVSISNILKLATFSNIW